MRLIDVEFGESAFVVDRHRRAVVHGILDVVDAHVVAEHCASVFVGGLHGRPREAHEGRVRQGVAEMLGEPVLVSARLTIQHGAEAVLRAVRLIGDHHDVGSLGQARELGLVLSRDKLLHRCEENAAGRAALQKRAQLLAVAGLLRCLLQQGPCALERVE